MFRPTSLLSFLTIIALCLGVVRPLRSAVTFSQTSDKGQSVRPVAQLPAKPKRYALLIGVDSYDDRQITGLRGAANDTRVLEAALVRNAGFDPDRIVRLASDQPREFQPTRGNILKYLSNILRTMPPDGLLWLAFSGHGVERNRRAFLLPADAQVNDDVKLLEKAAIEVADIKDMIREKSDGKGNITGVSQVVILLDACRNDPTSGKDLSINPMTKAYDFNLRNSGVQAFVTLYATSVGNRAYEDATRQRGYFIGEVVEALNGAAANERGEVTLERLIEHVEDKVPTKVSLHLGREQKPFHEIEGYRSGLVLALANPSAPASVTLPVIVNMPPPKPAVTMAKVAGPPAPLVSFGFTTAQIDAEGNVTKQPGRSARGFTEEVNGVKLEMVELPGGTFMMGSPVSEKDRDDDERPHQVTVSGFYLGKYEVTQAQWQAVMDNNPSNFKGDNLPVESVSWEDAGEFCHKLSAMTGRTYRLPTEAEWEYAARAGTTTTFGFGATITPEVVRYDGNYPYGNAAKGLSRKKTVPVGSLGLANSFGLYDLHGNVWEWCSDWFGTYANGSQTNPMGATSGENRVLRGGSWRYPGSNCRSAIRHSRAPGVRTSNFGFRVVVAARAP